MGDPTVDIIVTIVDHHNNKLTEQPHTYRPPRQSGQLIDTFKNKYGVGDLLEADGLHELPSGEDVHAGTYIYRVTPAAQAAQAAAAQQAGAYGNVQSLADLLAARVTQELAPVHQALSDDIKSWHSSHAVNASRLKGAQLDALRRQLKVVFIPDPDADAADVLAPDASDESDFEWDNTPEPAQREAYMAQITSHVQLNSRNLLWKTQVPARYLLLRGLGFSVAARSDELIAVRLFHGDAALGCVVGIELKKRLSHASRRQGETELYTFGLTSNFPFVQVVTDMVQGGFAYWKSGEQEGGQVVHEKVLVSMGQVYEFLRQVVAALPSNLGQDVGGRLVMPQQFGTTYHVMKVRDPVVTGIQAPLIRVEKGDVGNEALDDLLPWFDQEQLRLVYTPSYIS